MIDVLKKAQGNFCCYCMRDLSQNSGEITLEHIIPQKADSEDVEQYRALGIPSFDKKVLLLDTEFVKEEKQEMPPYPHTVAFDNFFNSCAGTFPDKEGSSQCCNNRRGNDFCLPLPLYSDAENMVEYSDNGNVAPSSQHQLASQIAVSIAAYHLNCNDLKHVRRLWFLFRNKDYNMLVDGIHDSNLRFQLLQEVLYKDSKTMEIDCILFRKFQRESYWKTFLSYHWFQQKFRQIYP